MEQATRSADPAQFYDAHVFVCCNRRQDGHPRGSCAAAGSEKLRDYMKLRARQIGLKNIRINQSGCLDRCELGPCIVVYPEGVWYKMTSEADVDAILQRHIQEGGRVQSLLLHPDQ
jgi:(2Fe-2S) ferredoxin